MSAPENTTVDEHGVRRIAVFYKAAFYDRRAHARVVDPPAEANRG